MAPSNVFSKFRPHHKRTGSNPTSPDPSSQTQHAPVATLQTQDFSALPPTRVNDDANQASSSPISSFAPILPPIPRVTSIYNSSTSRDKPQKDPAPSASNSAPLKPETPASDSSPRENLRRDPSRADEGRGPEDKKMHRDGGQPGAERHVQKQMFADAVRDLMRKDNSANSTSYKTKNQSTTSFSPPAQGPSPTYTASTDVGRPAYPKLPSAPAVMNTDKRPVASRNTPSSENTSYQPKSKGRLTLLNPMSLWSRRRSGQSIDTLSSESIVSYNRGPYIPAMTLPDDYDPRIRGKVVHDFSAPRPRRIVSYNDGSTPAASASGQTSGASSDRPHSGGDYFDSQRRPAEREHAAVFTEHFEDATSSEASAAAVRAEQLANKDFLARASMVAPPSREPPPVPTTSQQLPASLASRRSVTPPAELSLNTNRELPPLSPVAEASPALDRAPDMQNKTSTKSAPKVRSRAASGAEPWQPAGLLTHMTSKASRFSFQIAGADSDDQEKLLEERHKQKAAAKASTAPRDPLEDEDYFDEDAMYDPEGMDDFDGFEEKIPGVNADGEDEFGYGYGYGSMPPGIQSFNLPSLGKPLDTIYSPVTPQGEMGTALDPNDGKTGFPASQNHTAEEVNGPSVQTSNNEVEPGHGLGLLGISQPQESSIIPSGRTQGSDANDELYFDDGMIDVPEDLNDDNKFDESLLDDPTGPFFERPAPKVRFSNTGTIDEETSEGQTANLAPKPSVSDHTRQTSDQSDPKGFLTPSDFATLNAYHSALAEAATKAAESGRFDRKDSVDLINAPASASPDQAPSDTGSSRPSLVPDDGRFSQTTSAFSPTFGVGSGYVDEDYYTSDFDDNLDDDPIIAAANAEALANDYEGEYGREFGFWANADPKSEAVFSNGGYFGPRETMLGRSTSGRNAMREPNLTPITERSEISARNSFISFSNQFGTFSNSGAVPSPGLAQLARMSPYGFPEEDADMSMEKLMKLRGKAFGSSASLASGGSSPRNQSPVQFLHTPSAMNGPGINAWDDGGHGGDEGEDTVYPPAGADYDDFNDDDAALDAVNNGSGESDEEANYTYDYDQSPAEHDADNELSPESPTITASSHQAFAIPANDEVPPIPKQHKQPLPPISIPSTAGTSISSEATKPPSSVAQGNYRLSLMSPLSPISPFAIPTSPFGVPGPQSATSPTNPQGGGWHRPPSGSFSPTSGGPLGDSWRTHSRKGSAADSVTYVREQDELTGENRWVLERRRTASTGELELVGREVVEGGRI